jgi:hypothetical protein
LGWLRRLRCGVDDSMALTANHRLLRHGQPQHRRLRLNPWRKEVVGLEGERRRWWTASSRSARRRLKEICPRGK